MLGALRGYHHRLGVDVDDATVALGLPVGLGTAVVDAPLVEYHPAARIRAVREFVLSPGRSGPVR